MKVLFRRIVMLIDQVLMIFNLPTLSNDRALRLRRLRRIYYHNPKATISHGQVRDILHGHVEKTYRSYYERLLSIERLIYTNLQSLPNSITYQDLLIQTQRLGDRLAAIIDEIQALEHQRQRLAKVDELLAEQVQQQMDVLHQQLEKGFAQQAQISTSMQQLLMARTNHEYDRVTEALNRLSLQLEDIAASYADLTEDPIARALRNELDED
ncbi:MAG: hypothetical protein CUN55_01070 [Phototrophicales bacterium]|nr:MAG: hypothetical protein CUN55_01070 [Phototrophicales bacterium]